MFEERCISLMDEMFEENEELAIHSLKTKSNIWGICSSPLTFAYENFMYDIIAHPCSQKYMNNRWWNNLDADMMSFLKVSKYCSTRSMFSIIFFLVPTHLKLGKFLVYK